jgi:hypothetical protein
VFAFGCGRRLPYRRIVEHGTHDDLLTHNGRYTQLWIDRQRAHGWRLATADQ